MMKKPFSMAVFVFTLMMLLASSVCLHAQEKAAPVPPEAREPALQTSPVIIDGTKLFWVRGIQAYPAEKRSEAIAGRISKLAEDTTIRTDSIILRELSHETEIISGPVVIMVVFDADASLEGVKRHQLARIYAAKIRSAIESYRKDRTEESLLADALYTLLAAALLSAFILMFIWLSRRTIAAAETRLRLKIKSVSIQSVEIIRAERILAVIKGLLKIVRAVIILVVLFIFIHYSLSLFPWTRSYAASLAGYVVAPLRAAGNAALKEIPALFLIAVIIITAKYVLGIARHIFKELEKGTIVLSGFDRDWSRPTYNVVRLVIIAFAAVVVYPYIPWSNTPAFKGVSLFLGAIFTLSSSSVLSNVMAGYAMIYRRVFRVGDRVKIAGYAGDVMEVGLQVTHLKTIKNEEVIVPNSLIVNSEVVNFSSVARDGGLILHTIVGIGYDAPWRQVNAMLLLAAECTQGLLREPAPFVRQLSLNQFDISYELNVYTDNPQEMARIYSDLHERIQDEFNRCGVQIMTPAYENDPETPKVVPEERWYAHPSRKADGAGPEETHP